LERLPNGDDSIDSASVQFLDESVQFVFFKTKLSERLVATINDWYERLKTIAFELEQQTSSTMFAVEVFQ
jgi:hypothetical protein